MKLSTLRSMLPKVVNGNIRDLGNFLSALSEKAYAASAAPASIATAGAATYTAAQILGGIIVRDPAGASRTDVLPTAALLVAAMTDPEIGDMVRCSIINGADAAEVITINAGTGGTFDTNQTTAARVINQFFTKVMHLRLTNVTPGSEAYVVYF